MVTLRNSFHDSEVTVRCDLPGDLSPRVTRRVQQSLCGVSGCVCGVIRGPQDIVIDVREDADGREYWRLDLPATHDEQSRCPACDVELYGNAEAAALVGVSADTWRQYVSRGTAPAADARVGGSPVWTRLSLDEWMLRRRQPGRPTRS